MASVMTAPSPAAHGQMTLSPDPDDDSHEPDLELPMSRPEHPPSHTTAPQRQQSRGRPAAYATSRMSAYSHRSAASRERSRPHSAVAPAFPSSLSYASVRDFAYPPFHPMHFGASPEDPSAASTPGSDAHAPGRRMSDSAEGSTPGAGRGTRSAGPWGGDGVLYGDPQEHEEGHGGDGEALPRTSFGRTLEAGGEEWGADETSFRKSKHRKSRSFADIPNYERGRRRESGNGTASSRHSVHSGSSAEGSHLSAGLNADPAGRDALRQSRGFTEDGGPTASGESYRRDSHIATTLPSRSFHTGQPVDLDSDLPLDAEPSHHSPQRESMGPEDEELFAGPSLALYSFEPENDNELRLTEGQTILVSYRHGQGWLVAENPHTGEQGLVPEQYVRLLRDIEGWDEERGGFIDDDDEFDGNGESEDLATPTNEHGVPDTMSTGGDLDYDAETKKIQKQ